MKAFSPEVTKELRYYVYLYLDPESDEVFYVGKGKSNRAFAHLEDQTESDKTKRIKEIRSRGQEPKIEILTPPSSAGRGQDHYILWSRGVRPTTFGAMEQCTAFAA